MTISGIASTALDFLATIAPDDRIWDLDSIEVFVSHVQSLATQKRHERETLGIDQAMAVLRAEIAMLPDGDLGIDLGLYDYFPVKLFSQSIEQRIAAVEDKQQGEKYLKKSIGVNLLESVKDINEALNNEQDRHHMKAYFYRKTDERPDFLDAILKRHGIVSRFGEDAKKALDSILPYIKNKVKSLYTGDNIAKNDLTFLDLRDYLHRIT